MNSNVQLRVLQGSENRTRSLPLAPLHGYHVDLPHPPRPFLPPVCLRDPHRHRAYTFLVRYGDPRPQHGPRCGGKDVGLGEVRRELLHAWIYRVES